MNLDELRSVQSKERQKDSLQQLRESFYQDVASYITDLRAERDRRAEQVDNPFSDDEVRRLSDELDTAEEVAEALYERRVGKVVKLASFAAADMSASEEGMTIEEQELFDDLVDRIKQNKASILDVLAGEGDAASGKSSSTATDTNTSSPATAAPEPTADDEPTTIGGANPHDAGSPTPPEATAETEADDVLANAMGATSPTESASTDRPPAEGAAGETDPADGTNAGLGDDAAFDSTDTDGDDGVPTPDGGSTVRSSQPSETPEPNQAPTSPTGPESGTSHSEPSQPESTTESVTPAGSEMTTDTATTTPDTESPSTEPDVAESPATGSPATEQVAEPEAGSTSETGSTVDPAASSDSTPRTMVRVTDDVGTIFAVDEREYTLQPEDIVTLPTTNAEVLLQQDAATKIE
jgi:DNA replication factor GINS